MCKRSESITNLAVALCNFNKNVQRIEKDATNPHFRNKYASLDTIMDEVRPMLAEQGLSILQMPSGDADQLKLTTMLVHISGEWIESDSITMRPTKSDPQGIGSATTYARRYGLCAFLGLSTGDVDDDGNSVSQAPQAPQSTPRSQPYKQPSKPAETPTSQSSAPTTEMISDAQKGKIRGVMGEKKIPNDVLKQWVSALGLQSSNDLTKKQASDIIKKCESYMPVPVKSEDDLPF